MYVFIFVAPGRLLARFVNRTKYDGFGHPYTPPVRVARRNKKVCRVVAVCFYLVVFNLLGYAVSAAGSTVENTIVTDSLIAQERYGFKQDTAYPMTLGSKNVVFEVNGRSWYIPTPSVLNSTITVSTTEPPSISFWTTGNNEYFGGVHQVRRDKVDCEMRITNLVLTRACTDKVTESSWHKDDRDLSGWLTWAMNYRYADYFHATMVMTPEMHDELIGKIG